MSIAEYKILLNPGKWTGSFAAPKISDVRWRALLLLWFYLGMGMFFLGFSRKPMQIVLVITAGALLDMLLAGILQGQKKFPLSAMISCSSLAILLNWSFDLHNLFLPVFICILSKYVLTFKGKHFFNPSLFAIVACILLGNEAITLAPSYQWYGSAATAWMMTFFVITGALLLFVFKINRTYLILAWLITFTVQTIVRAVIMKHIIPYETLIVGSLTSPAFYLFSFYMITDPATSPPDKKSQILVGVAIGLLDLIYHLKLSYYTFFFAGFTVAASRFIYFHIKALMDAQGGAFLERRALPGLGWKYSVLGIAFLPAWLLSGIGNGEKKSDGSEMQLELIDPEFSGLIGRRGSTIESVDPRVAHVAKWVLSVGDAAASADINLDGLPDLFLTQPLKSKEDMAKLYINKGGFKFEKVAIPDLERYLDDPKVHGIPGFALFMDHDNDGDDDLFLGFGFGRSHYFENKMIPDGRADFKEVDIAFLAENTVCLAANAADFDNDGRLDLLLTNTLHQYLPDYGNKKVALNLFDLPKAEYEGDRRMFHFLHESWHNADNGGLNYLLHNKGGTGIFEPISMAQSGLKETRWSLAVGTLDMNEDGLTDLFIANDFGRDDWYINKGDQRFERIQGVFYGDVGLDTYKGMNASVGDLDGNGKEDIYISNVHHAMQAEGSLLWMNEGKGKEYKFKESAQKFNLLNTNRFGWGAAMADLNLDGWLDVIQANGMVDDAWDKQWDEAQDFWYYQAQIARTGPEIHSYADKWADIRGCYIYPNELDRISLNQGGKSFSDATEALGFVHKANTRGVCAADFDNDGDVDLLVTHQFGHPFLYETKVNEGQQWLGLTLEGNGITTNRNAVGTQITITYKEEGINRKQMREKHLANGFSAQGDGRILFGLGQGKITDLRLDIKWHNGQTLTYHTSSINQYIKISQNGSGDPQ
ncbi:MAG: VCBS repeat-containing protein [Saprospiraceae bacterium]|nr:VCBS repeat-containing protein [Saprospiraceae bacterium]